MKPILTSPDPTEQEKINPFADFKASVKLVQPTLEDTVSEYDVNFRRLLRATIDAVDAKQFQGSINAPRALPKLNKRVVQEFPLYCLGGPLQDVVLAVAAKVQCHQDIAAQVILGYASLALQGHVDVKLPWSGAVVPSSLFLATVADSGDRKSSADKEISPIVQRWESELSKKYKREMPLFGIQFDAWDKNRKKVMADDSLNPIQKAGLIGLQPVRPTPPVLTGDNPTVEGLRDLYVDGAKVLGLFSDDGGTFLGGHGMSDEQALKTIATLSKMWEAGPMNKIRAKGSEGVGGYRRMEKYRLAVHLMIQPSVAEEFFGNKMYAGQGLLSRFLVAWPDAEELDGQRFSQDFDPKHDETIKPFNQFLYQMLSTPLPVDADGELKPTVLQFTLDADNAHKDWNNKTQSYLVAGGRYASVKGLVSKALEHAARIAATLERIYDSNATHISEQYFRNALEIMDYYIAQQLETAATKNNPAFVKAHKLYDWLDEHSDYEYVNSTYLLQRSPFRKKEELMPVIATLEEFGLMQDGGPGHIIDGYGVAKKSWKVNRGLYE